MTQRSVTHASFTLERRYKATPARVFRALSDEASKQKWFTPPETWGKDEHAMDFRVGGIETSVGGPIGGPVHKFKAIYQDIVPDQRIIYTYDMHLDEVRISVSVSTFELVPDGDHTVLKLTEMGAYLDGFEDGNAIRKEGTAVLLDNLGRYLEREGAN
ncbi:SRPBCC family protein [Devosia ginsengisoli]|uniref:SRPBCC family protein n=1 Tax=Devosia ginsengisoli TaxID=400770 RepID=UPI0026EBEB68|nr:SRPBCC family protein [Devosia ginsengisoli]MCR6673414.1 SRPBCC family protein [Devosia ginsengisoli]